ncbi:MAG: putative motility protein [Parvibaculum sp.]|uniref:putative motility protein n=1 Tax=Parvibaculum sp. TaxID=2024848 RepID=UPI0032EB1C2D
MSISGMAAAAAASQQNQIAQAMQAAMLRAGHEQEKAMVDMLAEAAQASAKSTPPTGLGNRLDITA